MLLIWKDGRCTNPPQDWAVTVMRSEYSEGWRFCASKNSGFGGIDDCHYATERQAQLACEAALVRLGILPLPEWTARDATLAHIVAPTGELWAEARRAGPIGYTWELLSIWDACGDVITFDEAQAAAERHLRAEYAAWLEAQAAKEGAP